MARKRRQALTMDVLAVGDSIHYVVPDYIFDSGTNSWSVSTKCYIAGVTETLGNGSVHLVYVVTPEDRNIANNVTHSLGKEVSTCHTVGEH